MTTYRKNDSLLESKDADDAQMTMRELFQREVTDLDLTANPYSDNQDHYKSGFTQVAWIVFQEGYRVALDAIPIAQPVAQNVGAVDYDYQATFNAIAKAAKPEANGLGISVKTFWDSYRANSKPSAPQPAQPVAQPVRGGPTKVLLEHSGCGNGKQMEQLNIGLHRGDKVVLVMGAYTAALEGAK